MNDYLEWIQSAPIGSKFILILKDLEDLELYPIYFISENDLINYKNNIISESKIKIVSVIEINN